MDVSGMRSVQGIGPARSANPAASAVPANEPGSKSVGPVENKAASPAAPDEIEISAAARMLDRSSETPDARAERIAQIKAAIESGDYDSDFKLEAALERLFEVHGFDVGDE